MTTRKLRAVFVGVILFVAGFALGALSNRYEVSVAGSVRGVRFMRVDKWTGHTWDRSGLGSTWSLVAEPPKPPSRRQIRQQARQQIKDAEELRRLRLEHDRIQRDRDRAQAPRDAKELERLIKLQEGAGEP